MANTRYIVSVILLLLGAFYALMPHSMHIASGIGFGLVHTTHIVLGIVLVVVGSVLFVLKR